jgi:hypothetical protein
MILIAGDSWSAGEWANMNVQHCGLAQYLNDSGHIVCNLGQGGGWNSLTTQKLESFLKLNHFNLNQISHIIVFQTEWIRDLIYSTSIFEQDFDNNFQSLRDQTISSFYYKLSELGQTFNKKIYVIGGASDTIWVDKFSQEYPNVEIVCQSLTKLLIDQDHRIDNPVFCMYSRTHIKIINQFKTLFINKDLDLLLNDIDLGGIRLDTLAANKEFFWPDGYHPNRHGHRILFNFLRNQNII